MDCATCLELHGRGCEATHEDAAGKWVCLFCLDETICPIQAKRLRDAKKNSGTPPAASGESEKPASEVESEEKMPELRENSTETAPKLCKRPGCETQLSPRNSVGLCQKHVRWTAPGERVASSAAPTNGHAPGNGHAKANGSNGAAAVLPELALDRVDHLIASIPAADKARLAFAWLKGEL